jgi:hypothetical protein
MTQNDQILKHLKNGPITPMEALNDYGCFRLASRINDLKNAGHNIVTDMVEQDGKRFAKYRLKRR